MEPTDLPTFTIQHIDSLGQGVAKHGSDIYFIPKTLPGEAIRLKVKSRSKGVYFARLIDIISRSPLRQIPECRHFDQCSGCQFLHCSHQQEIEFKRVALLDQIRRQLKWNLEPVLKIHPDEARFFYRNRLQLHYNYNSNLLGLMNDQREILPIPFCQLPVLQVQETLTKLYEQNHWKTLKPPHAPLIGHVEIEWMKSEHIKLRWNVPYAADGFSQVNERMNRKLQQRIFQALTSLYSHESLASVDILDLFCGSGNLSQQFQSYVRQVQGVDVAAGQNQQLHSFFALDLFHPKALEAFKQQATVTRHPDVLMVDPPRKGFTQLEKWCHELEPKYLFLLSCHYPTLIRDLKALSITSEQVLNLELFDMFPGTGHCEVFMLIKLR